MHASPLCLRCIRAEPVGWERSNWYAGNRNQPPEPALFLMWDTEYSWNAGAEPSARVHEFFRPDRALGRKGRLAEKIWQSQSRGSPIA